MKKHFFILFVLVNCVLSFSKNKKIDSVYKVLKLEKIDTSIIKSHIDLSYYFYRADLSDSAVFHAKLANKLAFDKKYIVGVVRSYRELGNIYFNIAEYDQSIYYYKKALSNITDKKSGYYFDALNGVGNSFFYIGDYINAYEYYLKYLQQAEVSGTYYQKAKGNSNVGVILKEQRKYDEALVFFNKTVKIGLDINDFKTLFVGYSNKGNIFNEKAKLNKSDSLNLLALDNYNKAKEALLKIENSDFRNKIILDGNIGNVYADLRQYDKAILSFTNAIKEIDENDYFPQTALIYNNLTAIYLDLNNLKMVDKYIKLANEISIESQSSDNLAQSYQNYARYYELKGDFKNALESYKLYKSFNDSTFNAENTERLKELQLKVEFEKKESIKQSEQKKKDVVALEEKNKQRVIILAISVVLIMVIVFAFFIFNGLKRQRKANVIISMQKEEVHRQKEIIEEHQKETIDSINYAKRIQYALLAHDDLLKKYLPEHFILFNPKDIVSGDFYWATEHNDKFYFAVCDSTGHGVPGAFMSLLNIGFLSEAIKEKNINEPHLVLNYVRQRLIDSIGNDGQKDGMDAILICIDNKSKIISYAAANNEPILIKNGIVHELLKDRMPVGKGEKTDSFKLHTIQINSGDVLYLYTDGFADQFGGPKGKKFKYKSLNELLLSLSDKDVDYQKEILSKTFIDWKGDLDQVDDVCIIGIKL